MRAQALSEKRPSFAIVGYEMPPSDADDELLPEIDDDAIVAQQADPHAPAPRVQVIEEARTIVVAPARGRNDPTMVVRAVRHPLPYLPGPVAPPAPRGTPVWVPWLVWGVAGLIALLLGGALALIADRSATPRSVEPSRAPPPAPSAISE